MRLRLSGTSRNPDFKARFPYSHFTWAWHAAIMGTGITSALLTNFPYGGGTAPLHWLGFALFVLNLTLFIFVCGCTIARYIIFPEVRICYMELASRLISL